MTNMLDTARQNPASGANQNQFLVMQTPTPVDVDLVWDAVISFVEDVFGIDIVDNTVLSWSEVTKPEFDDALAAQVNDTASPLALRSIWTAGQIALIAPEGQLSPQDWALLQDTLEASQDDGAPGAGWRVVIHPSAAKGPAAAAPAPRSDSPPPVPISAPAPIPRADRRKSVPATPEQEAFLTLRAAQQEGQHPTLAMRPIFLEDLNQDALTATFEALQERHECLHTAFKTFEGRDYIVLDDRISVPLHQKTVIRQNASLERLAEQKTRELSQTLHETPGNWQAAVFEVRTKAALVCVFSQTIADQTSIDLFRAELIAFYQDFCEGRDPEANFPAPERHYTDFAALPRDLAASVSTWELLLPLDPPSVPAFELPVVAPATRRTQKLPEAMAQRLNLAAEDMDTTAEALILQAFLQSMQQIDEDFTPWVILPVHDVRPPQADDILGQFTKLCPFWVGDIETELPPKELEQRIEDLRSWDPLGFEEVARILPDRVPHRIAYAFEYARHITPRAEIDVPQDISLVVQHDGDSLIADWAIRLDHPLCKRPRQVTEAFQRFLDQI